MADDEEIISYGQDYGTLSGLQKNLVGLSYKDVLGLEGGDTPRSEEDLKLTEKDIKGFVKRRKAAIKQQKDAGSMALVETILKEQASPRVSLDYFEVLPMLPGAYRQSKTAIKDKLIAEQLDIAQQKEDYKAALSNTPAPNFGIMSPRELVNTLKKTDFTPLAPTGMGTGPIVSPPDEPTDPRNLPFFSLTGPSEYGPTAGGALRLLGAAQFANPLVKPPGATFGSGFGFKLKGMKGLTGDEYLTKSILANIQKNSDVSGKDILRQALSQKGVTVKDRFGKAPTVKKTEMDAVFDDDVDTTVTRGIGDNQPPDELVKLPEFDTNLPDNTKIIKEAIAKGNPNDLPILRVKDLNIPEELSNLEIIETRKSPFYSTNVKAYFNSFPEGNAFSATKNALNLPFKVTFSEEGVGLKAKGVTSPYSYQKKYLHPSVVGEEGGAPIYGHVRSLQLKELAPDTVHPYTASDITDYNKGSISKDLLSPGMYTKPSTLSEYNMLDPSKKVPLQKQTVDGVPEIAAVDETGNLNNYGIEDFDFILEYPRNVDGSYDKRKFIELLLNFKMKMQEMNAILKYIPVPNIELQRNLMKSQNFSSLTRGAIEKNRMNINEVLQYIRSNLKQEGGDTPDTISDTYNAIVEYAKRAIHNSFTPSKGFGMDKRIFLPGVFKTDKDISLRINFGDASRYGMGEPITVDSLENLFKTFAKIKAQQSIFKPKEARLSTTRVRPKISIGDPSGKFQVADDLSTAINLTDEANFILDSSGTAYNLRKLRQWENLGGPELYNLYRKSAPTEQNVSNDAQRMFPVALRNRLQEIEKNWGKGNLIKRLGEEQFDTFKRSATKGFTSPEAMLQSMRMTTTREGTLSAEEQMQQFERYLDKEQGVPTSDIYMDNVADRAFANLQNRPDKLVEMSTLHNVKQAIKDGFDKLQFNTFTTMAKLAGWSGNLTEPYNYKLIKEYIQSPLQKENVSSADKHLFNILTDTEPREIKTSTVTAEEILTPFQEFTQRYLVINDIGLDSILPGSNNDIAIRNPEFFKVKEFDKFYKFWEGYNDKFDLDRLVHKFFVDDVKNNDSKIINNILNNMDDFALKGMGLKRDAMTPDTGEMVSPPSEVVELFSDKTSKEIVKLYKGGTLKSRLLGTRLQETEEIKEKIISRLNIIQYFKPPLGRSIFSFHKQRANNPFYLKYGKPTDEKLADVIARIPKSQAETTPKNLGFSLQYGKYKMKTLEKLGLNPKVITPSEENGLTFIEVDFNKSGLSKEELLQKLEKAEIDLYSQYMPVPNFEERNEEEMGGT
jgi:hypothetical protein